MKFFCAVFLLLLIHSTYSVWIPAQWVDDDQLAAWDAFLESQAIKWNNYAGPVVPSVPLDEATSTIDSLNHATVRPNEKLLDVSSDDFTKNHELPTYEQKQNTQNFIASQPAVGQVSHKTNINSEELNKVPLPCGCLYHHAQHQDPEPLPQTTETTSQPTAEIAKQTRNSLHHYNKLHQDHEPQHQTTESTLQLNAEIAKPSCGCLHHHAKPQQDPKPLPQTTEATLQLTAEIAKPACGCLHHHSNPLQNPKPLPQITDTTLQQNAEIAKPSCGCLHHHTKPHQDPKLQCSTTESTLQPNVKKVKPSCGCLRHHAPHQDSLPLNEQPPCTQNTKPNPPLQQIEIPTQPIPQKPQHSCIQAQNTHSIFPQHTQDSISSSQPEVHRSCSQVANLPIQNSEYYPRLSVDHSNCPYDSAQSTRSQLLQHTSSQKSSSENCPQYQTIAEHQMVSPTNRNKPLSKSPNQHCGNCFKSAGTLHDFFFLSPHPSTVV